jgi:hypothetical protein
MRIEFSPIAMVGETLTLEKVSGDRIRINGDLFNFDPMNDGDTIPMGAVPSPWINGPVKRINGEIHLPLLLPHGSRPEPAQAFPEPITVTEDGPIDIPADTTFDVQYVEVEGGLNMIVTTRRWHQPDEVTERFIPTEPEPEPEAPFTPPEPVVPPQQEPDDVDA